MILENISIFSYNTHFGLYLDNGDGNNITGNIISHNDQYGIALTKNSENNEIYGNFLCYNTLGDILDLGTNNIYDNGDCTSKIALIIIGYSLVLMLCIITLVFLILLFKTIKSISHH